LAAWLESIQQFCLLRGELGLGQNTAGMQPLYSSEYVLMPTRSSAGRGLLLRGCLMHWFGRCLRSVRLGKVGRRLTSTPPSWLEKLRKPDPGRCCENPLI
jgi:hypothetical protein